MDVLFTFSDEDQYEYGDENWKLFYRRAARNLVRVLKDKLDLNAVAFCTDAVAVDALSSDTSVKWINTLSKGDVLYIEKNFDGLFLPKEAVDADIAILRQAMEKYPRRMGLSKDMALYDIDRRNKFVISQMVTNYQRVVAFAHKSKYRYKLPEDRGGDFAVFRVHPKSFAITMKYNGREERVDNFIGLDFGMLPVSKWEELNG
jgi:hypothetical protein